MRSINKNKLFSSLILLIAGLMMVTISCDNSTEEFEKKGPTKREARRVIIDVNIVVENDKTNFEAVFYYDIPGMVDGKEVTGLEKEIIKVNNAKLNEIDLKESKDSKNRIIYTSEIPNEKKEYELTFSPNDNLTSMHKIEVDPIYITKKNIKLEKSKIHELELSRKAIKGELPAIVEIKKKDDFLPARVEYLSQKLFFQEDALRPFPSGENTLSVRFETISNERDVNKSIRYMNYIIKKSFEISD